MSANDDRLRERLLEEMDALIDGVLPQQEAKDLRARIQADDALRAEYDRRRRTVQLVRGLTLERPAGDFAAETMARLPDVTQVSATRPPLLFWVGGLAAAAAIMIAVFVHDDSAPRYTEARKDQEEQGEQDQPLPDRPAKTESIHTLVGEPPAETKKVDAVKEKSVFGDKAAALGKGSVTPRDRSEVVAGKRKDARDQPAEPALNDVEAEEDAEEVDDEGVDSDAGAPLPAGTPTAEAPTTERRNRSKLVKRLGSTEERLVRKLETRGATLPVKDRQAYLDALAKLDDEALRTHLQRVGAGNPSADATLRRRDETQSGLGATRAGRPEGASAPLTFDLVVEKRAEAEAIRTIIARAFRPSSKRKRGGAKATRGAVAPSAVAADSGRGRNGELSLDCSVTPAQAGAMATWIARLRVGRPPAAPGLTAPGPKPGAVRIETSRKSASFEKAESMAVPVVIRIQFGPRNEVSERPAGEDK